MTNMLNRQIEMSFGQNEYFERHPQRREKRAQWWFRRMREIVDLAIAWEPAPRPRPVQIWFPASDTHRGPARVRVTRRVSRRNEQTEVCE